MKKISYWLVLELRNGSTVQISVPSFTGASVYEQRCTAIEVYNDGKFIPECFRKEVTRSFVAYSFEGNLFYIHGDTSEESKRINLNSEFKAYKEQFLTNSSLPFEVEKTDSKTKDWFYIIHRPEKSYHKNLNQIRRPVNL